MLPVLVSSTAGKRRSSRKVSGGIDGGVLYGNLESVVEREETELMPGGRDDGAVSLADGALGLLSREMVSLSVRSHASSASDANQGGDRRRRMALARTLLDVLETCYSRDANGGGAGAGGNRLAGDNHDGDPLSPESWPWNTAATERATHAGSSNWWHSSWPVRSLPLWGPQLADIAGDRSSRSSGGTGVGGSAGGGGALVVDRAAKVVEFVLRQHSRAAWRKAIDALRPPTSVSGLAPRERGGVERKDKEEKEVLPLCGPLLERICLKLPLMNLPVRVHAAVFEAHGWLALLPCGDVFVVCSICTQL